MMKRAALLLLALLASAPLTGCGGGSGISGSNHLLSTTAATGSSRAKGRAVVHVKWPVRAQNPPDTGRRKQYCYPHEKRPHED